MTEIRDMEALKQHRKQQEEMSEKQSGFPKINVSLATCSIAAGGNKTMAAIREELDAQDLNKVVLTQSGCMCYCHAEPTVEVTLPGKAPVIFGHVNTDKAKEIVRRYLLKGESVEGILPVSSERLTL